MVNYVRMAATAKRLIEGNGRTVTLVRLSRSPEDTDKPWRGPDLTPDPVPPAITCKAVIIPYVEKEVDGSNIKHGDKRAYIAETSLDEIEIETYDRLVDASVIYKIVIASLLNPGDVRLLYELQLRR
jgi:hypothetical protein